MHSRHSGPGHFRLSGPPGGCGEPERIYARARRRGMDLVTLTDLDTIDGCLEFLDRHPGAGDFMISEEVTVLDPRSRTRLRLLLYDITEAQHREVQRSRGDLQDLLACLREEGILWSLGAFLGEHRADARWVGRIRDILRLADRFEIRSGSLGRAHRALLARLVREVFGNRPFGITAGSGSHGPSRVGRTVTVSFARTRDEFLADLRANRTWDAGEEGAPWTSTLELARVLGAGSRSLIAGGERLRDGGRSRALGRARVSLPVHLSGASLCAHALGRARAHARIRGVSARLDRRDVRRFQQKARSYSPVAIATGSGSEEARP
ncbi:MAG: PHP domain-containing protein [Acidobacteriota bacterium]